ncbi:MAG: S-layer homology domain-containing protein, partial [Oscillospiraceae bacterium]|nr:S-layer homology domain-containing protein [Oscillospiraceae bacterium]
GSEAQPNVGAAMNDSPVDYQNRDVTEPQRDGDRRMAVDEVLSQYPDFDTVADYATDAVSYLIANGLVNGKSGRIAPTDYTTRAEVAVLISRILEYIK